MAHTLNGSGSIYEYEKLDIAIGLVRGAEVRNIFGYQEEVTTDLIPAWEFPQAYVYPTQGLAMTVSSDAGVADDGISVLISGLDEDYVEIKQVVVLNSALPPVTSPFFRINDVVCIAGGNNTGLITIANGLNIYAGIRPGDGRNQSSIYTVPAGKSFFLYRIDAFSADGTAAKPGLFENHSRTPSGQEYNTARTTFYNNMNIQRRLPFKVSEKTDLQLRVATLGGTHEMNVFSEGVLLTNDRLIR